MNFKIGEYNIVCFDIEESIHFYQNVLKFKLIEKAKTYAHFKFESITITLLAFARAKQEKLKYGEKTTFSLDLKVENLKEASKYFKEMQVEFAESYDKNEGYFAIYDPNNLIWEIVQA